MQHHKQDSDLGACRTQGGFITRDPSPRPVTATRTPPPALLCPWQSALRFCHLPLQDCCVTNRAVWDLLGLVVFPQRNSCEIHPSRWVCRDLISLYDRVLLPGVDAPGLFSCSPIRGTYVVSGWVVMGKGAVDICGQFSDFVLNSSTEVWFAFHTTLISRTQFRGFYTYRFVQSFSQSNFRTFLLPLKETVCQSSPPPSPGPGQPLSCSPSLSVNRTVCGFSLGHLPRSVDQYISFSFYQKYRIEYILFIHLSVGGHLGSFCFLALVNNAAVNIHE